MQVATIGLDLAKHVFQVHGVDAAGGDSKPIDIRQPMPWRDKTSNPTLRQKQFGNRSRNLAVERLRV
jgi:hypothetical protein